MKLWWRGVLVVLLSSELEVCFDGWMWFGGGAHYSVDISAPAKAKAPELFLAAQG